MTDDNSIQELLHKQAIAERLYLYARGWDRKQADLILDTFHPDATLKRGAISGLARELMKVWFNACLSRKSMTHLITNVLIEFRREDALTESNFFAHHRRIASESTPETDWFIKGRYLDRFQRRSDGIWRVAERVMVLDFERIVEPSDAELAASPSEVRGKFHPDDPLYAFLESP